jgi:hypothetical protein
MRIFPVSHIERVMPKMPSFQRTAATANPFGGFGSVD